MRLVFSLILFFILAMEPRVCDSDGCHCRLPSVERDGHLRCDNCKVKFCTILDRCVDCQEWDDERFVAFERYRLKRKRDRMYKEKGKQKGVSTSESFSSFCSDLVSASPTPSASQGGLVQGETSAVVHEVSQAPSAPSEPNPSVVVSEPPTSVPSLSGFQPS